jgi:hypothetical protein
MRSLRDRLQHITRPGDMRQVDLGPDLVFCPANPRSARRSFPSGVRLLGHEMLPHLGRFVRLERTGMGFLFGNAEQRKYVENGLALNFQIPGQVVDSNLVLLHPAFRFLPHFWLRVHICLVELHLPCVTRPPQNVNSS